MTSPSRGCMTEFGSAMFQPWDHASLSDSLIVTDGSRSQNDILRMEAVSRAGSNHNHLFDLATEELILCVP